MSRKVLLLLILFLLMIVFPPRAHAIIFLPALILIPIAKLVAIIVGGLSIPALSIGTIWSKLTKKSLKRTIVVVVIGLVIIGGIIALILKLENPARPIF